MNRPKLPGAFFLNAGSLIILIAASSALSITLILTGLYLAVVLVFYPIYYFFLRLFLRAPVNKNEIYFAKTDDGWELALHRHRPQLPSKKTPVIFLHGIFVNHYSVDLNPEHSLASYLAENGYDVFVPDLRAKGFSRYTEKGRAGQYSFDDLVRLDGSAIIHEVLKITGGKKVHWIGHSMGGMIGYALASMPGISGKIETLSALSAPGRADFIRNGPWFSFVRFRFIFRYINLRLLARLFVPVSGVMDLPPENFIYSKDNVSPKTVRRLKMNAVENTSPILLEQLSQWIETGKEFSLDGKVNYADSFKKIKCPALFLAGMRDQIANPIGVAHAHANCRSRTKKLLLFGRENGYSDYCHVGIVMGEKSKKEVFPHILKWLENKK